MLGLRLMGRMERRQLGRQKPEERKEALEKAYVKASAQQQIHSDNIYL